MSALSGDDLLDAIFPQGEDWAKPLRAIARSQNLGNRDTGAIRDAIRVAVTQPELPSHVEYVRVMSLHKSKGLTADLVVVVGCIEGLIPRVYDGDAEDDRVRSLEEQRRLFYVALTRARESLVLSSVKSLPRKLAFKMGEGHWRSEDPREHDRITLPQRAWSSYTKFPARQCSLWSVVVTSTLSKGGATTRRLIEVGFPIRERA